MTPSGRGDFARVIRGDTRSDRPAGWSSISASNGGGAAEAFSRRIAYPAPPMKQTTLSEYASKQLLADYGVRCRRSNAWRTSAAAAAAEAAAALGFPVALKLCGDGDCAQDRAGSGAPRASPTPTRCEAAAAELLGRRAPRGWRGRLCWWASMVGGRRELIAGLVRDPNFGPCVMLGLGGILAEALRRRGLRGGAARPRPRPGRCPDRLAAAASVGRVPRRARGRRARPWPTLLEGLARLAVERPGRGQRST